MAAKRPDLDGTISIASTLSSAAAFLAEPRGRHVMGASYAYACLDEALFCFAMWGSPSEADAVQLCRLLTVELAPTMPRHHSLVHFGAVERVDAAAFAALKRYVDDNAARLADQIAGQAVVFGRGGMSAMVVAGFANVFPPPYPARAFGSTAEAVAWMLPHRPGLAAQVDAFVALTRQDPPLVAQLRAIIEADLAAATLVAAALTLGCTPRTLQRRLRETGTSFQREYASVQLACAKRLLVETDTKISAIALAVGFTSASHFSQAFRRRTGHSPHAWRDRG